MHSARSAKIAFPPAVLLGADCWNVVLEVLGGIPKASDGRKQSAVAPAWVIHNLMPMYIVPITEA